MVSRKKCSLNLSQSCLACKIRRFIQLVWVGKFVWICWKRIVWNSGKSWWLPASADWLISLILSRCGLSFSFPFWWEQLRHSKGNSNVSKSILLGKFTHELLDSVMEFHHQMVAQAVADRRYNNYELLLLRHQNECVWLKTTHIGNFINPHPMHWWIHDQDPQHSRPTTPRHH